ncbi:hypothetical protein [Flavobacterium cellulosilyticum]|uniref:Uncharacterized protein n=1 Tax=Flavobacterium cellulosilyticum TaxID=2541731 RepID=A0A4R5CLS9_9FLAO|nr:hypothetical protein [Flavobacterium cellulosilyticum]TDD98442.1 hypothetical protein E0F76_04710 [Flavobacterium cellulosilyticum]
MNSAKKLGIWMDHSFAYLLDYSKNPLETKTIESKFTFDKKMEALTKSESLMHNKRQQLQSSYYKELGAIIKDYNHVLLFGPTNAKVELFANLREDLHFANIKIKIKEADQMTENQKAAFVNSYFLTA